MILIHVYRYVNQNINSRANILWVVVIWSVQISEKQFERIYIVLSSNFPENLEFAENSPEITHPEVGKYFQEYCKTYYKPNTEKMKQYPEDLEITRRKTAEFYHVEN